MLLDAMRRHSEEGSKAGDKKKGKGGKGKKAAGDGAGGEFAALGGMGSLDVATATALSALIPPWLLGASGVCVCLCV